MMDGEGVWKFADELHRELLALARGEAVKPHSPPGSHQDDSEEEVLAALARTIDHEAAEAVGRAERIAALKAAEFGGDDHVATAIAKCARMIAFNVDYDLANAAARLRDEAIAKCDACEVMSLDRVYREAVDTGVDAQDHVDKLNADGWVLSTMRAGFFKVCAKHEVAS